MVSNNASVPSKNQGLKAMACENSAPLTPTQSSDLNALPRTVIAESVPGSSTVKNTAMNGTLQTAAMSRSADNHYGLTAPTAPEGGLPVYSGPSSGGGADDGYGLTTPVAPEGGSPVYPGNTSGNGSSDNDYGLTTPIAPEGGSPVYPGGNTVGDNSTNGGSNTIWPTFPWFPTCPSCGACLTCGGSQNNGGNTSSSSPQYGQVRFLNASTANTNVSVTFDNTTYASSVAFGTITAYSQIADGFHTVSVRRTTGLRALVVQQSFPFSANQKYTLVLVDSAAGGVNLIQVDDTGCSNLSYNTGCYRVANMAYSGSSFDVFLYSHDAVFRSVGFQEVTSYKQAIAGSYQFYITNSTNYSLIRELPILIIGAAGTSIQRNDPLVSYSVDIASGQNYTSYLIGSSWSDLNFRVLTVQD